jgi:hypothetical protein
VEKSTLLWKSSKRLTPGKSGVGLVPPTDFVTVSNLPAKIDNAVAAQTRKIDQASRVIF